MVFATTKAAQLRSTQGELKQIIQHFVQDKIKGLIASSPIAGFGVNADEIVNAAVDGNLKSAVVAVASQKVRGILAKSPLGDMANKMGLDAETLTLLVCACLREIVADENAGKRNR